MSDEDSVNLAISSAFSKLLKTASEVIEDISRTGTVPLVSCSVMEGVFKVEVVHVVPPNFTTELDALAVKVKALEAKICVEEVVEASPEEAPEAIVEVEPAASDEAAF